MKHPFRPLLLALAVLALLASCSRTASFSIESGNYRNNKTGAVYLPVSDNYRSTGYFKDALLGTYRSPSGNVTSFYRVEGLDGVLTDEDYRLYVAEGASLPTFDALDLASADLCMSDAITVSLRTFDANDAERFRNAVLNGVSFSYAKVNQKLLADRYDLVFFAKNLSLTYRLIYQESKSELLIYEPLTGNGEIPDLYPGIHAEKTVVNGEEIAVFHFGTQFLYDRSAKTCYPIEKLTSEDA